MERERERVGGEVEKNIQTKQHLVCFVETYQFECLATDCMKFDWLLRFRFNRWTFLCGTCYTQLKWVFIYFHLLRYVLSWPWIHFFWHLQPVIMDLNSIFCAIMYYHIWTWYGNLNSIYIALKSTSIRCKNPFFLLTLGLCYLKRYREAVAPLHYGEVYSTVENITKARARWFRIAELHLGAFVS